jgi:hypothetical protein
MTDNLTLPRAVVEQVREALEAMQSYAAAERKGLRICDEAVITITAALAEPDAKPDALRRDAERYRWLKKCAQDYDGHVCFGEVRYPAPIPDCTPFDAIDAAIDAAMQEVKP